MYNFWRNGHNITKPKINWILILPFKDPPVVWIHGRRILYFSGRIITENKIKRRTDRQPCVPTFPMCPEGDEDSPDSGFCLKEWFLLWEDGYCSGLRQVWSRQYSEDLRYNCYCIWKIRMQAACRWSPKNSPSGKSLFRHNGIEGAGTPSR